MKTKNYLGLQPQVICEGVGRTFQIPRPFKEYQYWKYSISWFGNPITKPQAWSYAEEALELVGLPTDPNAEDYTLVQRD